MNADGLEVKLDEFLEFERGERIRKAERDARIEKTLEHVANAQVLTDRKLDVFAERVGQQMAGVHARLFKLETDAEITGKHSSADLRAALEAEKTKHGKTQDRQLAVIGAVLLAGLYAVGRALWDAIKKGMG